MAWRQVYPRLLNKCKLSFFIEHKLCKVFLSRIPDGRVPGSLEVSIKRYEWRPRRMAYDTEHGQDPLIPMNPLLTYDGSYREGLDDASADFSVSITSSPPIASITTPSPTSPTASSSSATTKFLSLFLFLSFADLP